MSLKETASAMVAPGKGVLAVDESTGTCTKRFQAAGIESTDESRRDYREWMFRTPGLGDYVSGAILYHETIVARAADGSPMVEVMQNAGIFPGIKVDTGTSPLAKADGEKITEGLDGLRTRMEEYRERGAKFTKWRAVLSVDAAKPTSYCIETNAHALGRYAALAQEAGLVPIVEPEVLMDGDHDIDRCQAVTETVLTKVFEQLARQRVQLDGIVLKPNMVIPASGAADQSSAAEIAERTLETLRKCVPAEVPGIAFLSGGQSGEEACRNLNEINRRRGDAPWQLTYSFGRALQYPGLEVWGGEAASVAAAQAALLHRCRMASLAHAGEWTPEAEGAAITL